MRTPIALLAAAAIAVVAGPAAAQQAERATAYINPDTGKPTANEDVAAGSSCASPDQADTQTAGGDGSTGNVHVDGCLTDASGAAVDVQASYEISGVGFVFACPDPDGAGPKTATTGDPDGDGLAERCTLSGFEDNEEYHVRVFADDPGLQSVTFCPDPEGDGCADASASSTVTISWVAGSAGGGEGLPNTGAEEVLRISGLLALAGAGGLLFASRRRTA